MVASTGPWNREEQGGALDAWRQKWRQLQEKFWERIEEMRRLDQLFIAV
jgi:hypothetical protein